ncbi:MAG: enoyl-CoA hydratase/isomerase family protein [Bacteriovorax sp.]|nr:enoyl-CoA hydratase/isomerase family protein [Bacteriovorax sp.]
MKALTRVPVFSYDTFTSTLLIPTKSLEIKFRKNYLNAHTLNELESILTWLAAHTEVQGLSITSFGEEFIQGFDVTELRLLSEDELKNLFQKLSTIAQSLMCLPQTVVVDMKKGTRGVGLELALAADIRIAKSDAIYCLNHLSLGLTPTCGLFSFLRSYLNQNVLRSLLLSGREFQKESLHALGGHCEYDLEASTIMANIFNQAPIARIQAKRGLLDIHRPKNVEELELEKNLFNAVVNSKDYTKESGFMSVAEFKGINLNHETKN